MRRILHAALKILIILVFAACSKDDRSTPEKIDVYVLFSPEGFCNSGYNDITLKSIEKSSQKYGFEYSFYVPETIEMGMEFYNSWLNGYPSGDGRTLFIFASAMYEEHLAQAQHPEPGTGKDILLFETESSLPYAYTFAMSYYGASYFIASYHLGLEWCDFKILAANPYTNGLGYMTDGIISAIEDNPSGDVECYYLGEQPHEGFDEQEEAFITCKFLSVNDTLQNNLYIPYAGLSNMGVYRFSETNTRTAIGMDSIDPNFYTSIHMSMNKRIDLAIDDFLVLWIKGEEVPRNRFYTLESGRVEVMKRTFLEEYFKDSMNNLYNQAISKEKEYFKSRNQELAATDIS